MHCSNSDFGFYNKKRRAAAITERVMHQPSQPRYENFVDNNTPRSTVRSSSPMHNYQLVYIVPSSSECRLGAPFYAHHGMIITRREPGSPREIKEGCFEILNCVFIVIIYCAHTLSTVHSIALNPSVTQSPNEPHFEMT
ncbi:hypothetical protein CBL_07946 [Carabus blaptoides fortunei]